MPITSLARSIPNMVLIVLTLIWFNKESAPYIVVFIMVFPVLYDAVLGSINNIDKSILEMTNLYKVRKIDKILTSKKFGIPIMILFLGLIFWLTIVGANYPSELLFNLFNSIQSKLINFANYFYLLKRQ